MLWLGRRHLGSEQNAALLALAYLAYPWMAWVAMDGFHPFTLAIPLLLLGVWFLDSDRLLPFALCAVAAATCGELVGVWIAALGLWYAFARGRRRWGLVISIVGLAWTVIAVRLVVPAFSGESSDYFSVYDAVGGSPSGVVRTAFSDPVSILSAVTHGGDFFYVAMLAIPLAGLFLLAPALAAVALPQFAATLLAGFPATTDPRAHYIAGIVPFSLAATALGLGRLSSAGRPPGVVAVLTLCVAFAVVLGPWPVFLGARSRPIGPMCRPRAWRRFGEPGARCPRERRPARRTGYGSHLAERQVLSTAFPWWVARSGSSWTQTTRGFPGGSGASLILRPWMRSSLGFGTTRRG